MNCNAASRSGPFLRPGFSPLKVGLMILGFIVFWPLGLAMLAYMAWGHRLTGFVEGLKDGFGGRNGAWSPAGAGPFTYRSGNSAFDEYRRRELERLEEERRRLDEERRDFEAYVRDLQRARDREEFERFMAERRRRTDGPTTA